MSVSFESKIDIEVSQSPPLLTKFDTATLSANISYNGNSQELSTYGSEITYQWLYSSDGGKTYRSIPSDTTSLSVAVDSENLNHIYKLQLSVLNPSYKLQSNISNAVFVDSEGNALTTNQYGTPDIVVWYSQDITVNHTINNSILAPIVDEEIEKNIVSVDLITEDGELLTDTPAEPVDDLEYSSDNIQENTDIVAMPTLPALSYGAVSSSGVAQQQNDNSIEQLSDSVIDCYKPISTTLCGVTFNVCRKETRQRTWADFFGPWPPADCVSLGQGSCKSECVFGGSTVRIEKEVGSWFNVEIDGGSKRKWCDSLGDTVPVGTLYEGALDAKGRTKDKAAILCPNPGHIKLYEMTDCKQGGPCPGYTVQWINGTLFGVHPLINGYYEATVSDKSARPPCYGPVTTNIQTTIYPNGKKVLWNPEFSCNGSVYFKSSYCECDGEKIYGDSCTETIDCQPVGPPEIRYESAEGLSVNAYPKRDANGKETKDLIVSTTLDITKANLTGGQTIQFNRVYASSDNHDTVKSFSVTIPQDIDTKGECDLYEVTMDKDPWGDCIQSVGTCAAGIPDGRKCYNSDKYYKWSSIGTTTVTEAECRADCNKAAANPPATATIFGIKPEQSRPIDPGGLLSLSEAEAEIAKASKNKPYYIQKYNLAIPPTPNPGALPPSFIGSKTCQYSCKDKDGFTLTKKIEISTPRIIKEDGDKSPYNLCEGCGCKQNKDCNGCEVCVGGNCVPPFNPGHPCQDSTNETCCIGYNTSSLDKAVSCADKRKCETCQPADGLFYTGETAEKIYKTELQQDCCNGTVFDTQCQKCVNDKIESTCLSPKECVYISDETVSIDGEEYTYAKYECKIVPCPPCQREADDYSTTGNCVPYDSTLEAKSKCQTCVIDNKDGELVERIISTLKPLEICCQTGATDFTPAELCCPNSNGYNHTGDRTQGCCGDNTYNLAQQCCKNGVVTDGGVGCLDCNGRPICPQGTTCCEKLDYDNFLKVIAVGCANPTNCEKCNDNQFTGNPVVVVDDLLPENNPDGCKYCNAGDVETRTSEDPDDPCYAPPEPQSIFFIP